MHEKLGINTGDCSLTVGQALTEFGSEESFEQAARRFQEHYGFCVERNWLRRKVEEKALLAEEYVAKILKKASENSDNNYQQKTDKILLQLDGSMIRTGIYFPAKKQEKTPKRKLLKKTRKIDWQEVRVGLARRVEQKEKRTFIARYGKYPELAQNLKSAAYLQGLSDESQIFAVADGAIGLKEALEAEFPNLQFILDQPHLLQHLYEGAEALKIPSKKRKNWVSYLLHLIEEGPVITLRVLKANYWWQDFWQELRTQSLA